KAVNYRSAGTVEFVVDAEKNFYFLEMNTRLQVEHPITEYVTGVDLVELMIRVANNEKLPLSQEDVTLTGWAIESRVYAEDPFRNFMPSIGRLSRYMPPPETDTVRVDTGIKEGSEVSMFYDPMIAKLITYGDTREEAMTEMHNALDQYYIRGVSHNISFLNALIAHPRFRAAELTTNFIAEEYPDGFHPSDVAAPDPSLPVAIAAAVHRAYVDRAAQISDQLDGHERIINEQFVVCIGDDKHPVTVVAVDGGFEISVDGNLFRVITKWKIGENLIYAEVNGQHVCFQLDREGVYYRLSQRGAEVIALVLTPRAAELSQHMIEKEQPDMSKFLLSPMPGLLVRLTAKAGDTVKAGEELAVVEAMKMENSLRADEDVTIAKVLAEQGDTLAVDQPIVEFE
ncbi:MAG: ATP-binding protein, partial [Gammaproteobacteria bacterium]